MRSLCSQRRREQMKQVDLKDDAAKLCLPVGPFRMMARDRAKIELFPGPGMLVMLFEDISHGQRANHPSEQDAPGKIGAVMARRLDWPLGTRYPGDRYRRL